MPQHVLGAFANGLDVLGLQVLLGDAAVHLDGADRRHDHRRIGLESRFAALDVEEFFGAQVRSETSLRDHVVRQLERRPRRADAVAAVRDVGERPTVHERRCAFQGLHQVGSEGVLQQYGHGAFGLQVTCADRLALARVGDDDVPQPLLQVGQVLRQAEDGHHFGGDGDVETVLARVAIADAAEAVDNMPQRTVVHVDYPFPGHAARIDTQLVAPVDVVIEHCGEQVVGRRDRVKIAGEVEVDVLHRHHLCITAAGGTAFHAETGTQRRLAQADRGILADVIEGVAQADARCRLALARRRRRDSRDED